MTTALKPPHTNLDNLLSHVTVRCCGHMHKIGLSHSGDLILFNHTSEEVRRYQTLGELGAEPVRCVFIYNAWVDGTIDHEKYPRDLSEFRQGGYEFAHRIQRKLRRIRLKAMVSKTRSKAEKAQLIEEYNTLVGPGIDPAEARWLEKYIAKLRKEGSYQLVSAVRNWFSYRVIEELVRRGWAGEPRNPKKLSSMDEPTSSSKLFDVGYRGLVLMPKPDENASPHVYRPQHPICEIEHVSGHIRIGNSSGAYVSSFSGEFEKPEDVRLQLTADVAEVGLINELVRTHRQQTHAQEAVAFETLAKKTKKSAKVNGIAIKSDTESSTVELSVTHKRLTIQAAQLLINTYQSIEPKIRAILQANEKRLAAEHRFPPTPDEIVVGHGAVPKREKVARIPAKWESEEDTDESEDDTD